MHAVIDDATPATYPACVADDIIRDAIKAEADRRKLNPYQLWKLVEGKVSRTTVYEFMSGNTSLTTETATHLLVALGISMKKSK